MQRDEVHGRGYVQHRVHEEIDQFHRHAHEFSLIILKVQPGRDVVPPRQRVDETIDALLIHTRPSDVVARAFDDTVAVLLPETDAAGARSAFSRLQCCLAHPSIVQWHVEAYTFPRDEREIRHLSFLTAA